MNGIEDELQGLAEVVRVNLNTKLGREIAGHFDVTSPKTTIVLDGNGVEVHRHYGRPQRQKVIELVRAGSTSDGHPKTG